MVNQTTTRENRAVTGEGFMGLFPIVGCMDETPVSARMTYGGYLRLEELLSLQDGPEGIHPRRPTTNFISSSSTKPLSCGSNSF